MTRSRPSSARLMVQEFRKPELLYTFVDRYKSKRNRLFAVVKQNDTVTRLGCWICETSMVSLMQLL